MRESIVKKNVDWQQRKKRVVEENAEVNKLKAGLEMKKREVN